MHFTQEDYIKIENWLHRNSVKDTEFQEAFPFTGKEIVTVVQDGHNRKVNIQEFINQLYKHGVEDFLNVTNTYRANNITLKEAIRLIPAEARKEGQVITFLNTDGNWEIYQFIGKLNQWNSPTLWNNPFDWEKLIVNSILPDEEYLTKSAPDAKGNSYLSLKDRKYEPDKYSGLGRKILRRRVVEIEDPIYGTQEKNLLLQADFDEENTVYVVRYDFTLNGQDIILPDNSYIEYEGGSISDGNIIDRTEGLSRIVLRKNTINGVNRLTQNMLSKPNTIYEIRYDFDLNKEEITVPENSILDFQGGSLFNGILVGSSTLIKGYPKIICEGKGIYINDTINVKWFGAIGDNENDDTEAFNRALSFIDRLTGPYQENMDRASTLYIPNGNYRINHVYIRNASIKGESSTNTIIRPSVEDGIVFELRQTTTYGPKVTVSNFYLNGDIYNARTSVQYINCFFGGGGIQIVQSGDILINNIIFDMSAKAISIQQSSSITITDCQFFTNALYAIKVISGINIIVANNNFNIWGPPVQIEAGDNITINNNTFKSDSATYYGNPYIISFKDTETDYVKGLVIISNNNFYDARGRYQGININTSFSNIIIQNNVFRKLTKAIWSGSVGNALIIDGNKFISSLQENIFCVNARNIITNNYFEGGLEGTGASYSVSIFIQSNGSIVKNNIQRFLRNSEGQYVNNFSYWLRTNETGPIIIEDNKIYPCDISENYIDDIKIESPSLFYIKNTAKHNNISSALLPNIFTSIDVGTPHFKESNPYVWNGSEWLLGNGGKQSKCEYLTLNTLMHSGKTILCNTELDLKGETVYIGSDITLDFSYGGKIINGTLVLSQTKIFPQGINISDYITANIEGAYRKGQCLYDDTINKPKWWTGSKWVDATGADV